MNLSFLFYVILFANSVYFFFRNNAVYNYRQKILKKMAETDMKKIKQGVPFEELYIHTFDKPSYWEMLFKFWWPLDSFYDEKLLKEIGEKI